MVCTVGIDLRFRLLQNTVLSLVCLEIRKNNEFVVECDLGWWQDSF